MVASFYLTFLGAREEKLNNSRKLGGPPLNGDVDPVSVLIRIEVK